MVTAFEIKTFAVPTAHPDFQYMCYQIEKCPQTKRLHVQGYLELKKQTAFNQVKMMFSPCKVHLEQRRARTNQKAIAYCTKAETRVEGPWHFGDAQDQHGAARTPIDWLAIRQKLWTFQNWNAVLCSDDPDLVRALGHKSSHCKELWQARPVNAPEPQITLRKWQKKVIEILDTPPQKRRVIWIWSHDSGTGKSTFFDYCSSKYDIIPGADWANTIFVYDGQPITWFDRTRADQWDDKGTNDFYRMLEKLSNGTIHTSTKYVPGRKLISCHVVVTANCQPDEGRLPNRCVIFQAKTSDEEEREEQEMLDAYEAQIEQAYVADLCNDRVREIPDGPVDMSHEAQQQEQDSQDMMHNTPTPDASVELTDAQPTSSSSFWRDAYHAAFDSPPNFVADISKNSTELSEEFSDSN